MYDSLQNMIGTPTAAEIVLPGQIGSISGATRVSTLAKYLDAPDIALGQRVTKTLKTKETSSKGAAKGRVTRALAFAVCHSGAAFEEHFPTYPGKTKRGKEWESFCQQFPSAAARGDILTVDEREQVNSLVNVVLPAFGGSPEKSIFAGARLRAVFSSSFSIEAGADILHYTTTEKGERMLRIIKLSLTDGWGGQALAMAALNGKYAMKGYAAVLAAGCTSAHPDGNGPVQHIEYEVLWVDKGTHARGRTRLISLTDACGHETEGRYMLEASISCYANMLGGMAQRLDQAQDKSVLAPGTSEVFLPLRGNGHENREPFPMPSLLYSETQIRDMIATKFPPVKLFDFASLAKGKEGPSEDVPVEAPKTPSETKTTTRKKTTRIGIQMPVQAAPYPLTEDLLQRAKLKEMKQYIVMHKIDEIDIAKINNAGRLAATLKKFFAKEQEVSNEQSS